MQSVDVEGTTIAYRIAGSGPPLVLLHGAVCDSRVWRVELGSFADRFTVVAWDAPGCGASSDPPEHWRMDDFARCLASFLEVLDLQPAHVLGHSWGSTLAFALAIRSPSLVRSLVIVGGYAGWAGSLPSEEVRRRLEFALRAADRDPGTFDPHTMPGLFSDVMPVDRARELADVMADIRPAGTRAMAVALAEADLRDQLGGIEAPVLLVAGDDDQRSPLAVADALHRSLRRSTMAVLPGLGHECFLESPSAFADAVRPFLLDH